MIVYDMKVMGHTRRVAIFAGYEYPKAIENHLKAAAKKMADRYGVSPEDVKIYEGANKKLINVN